MIEIIPNWHPVFVHFTLALLAVAGLLFIISGLAGKWQHRQTAFRVARWNFWIGTVITIATALAGWYAYNTVAHDAPSHAAMTLHRNWALATLVLLGVLALWLWFSRHRDTDRPSFPFMIVVVLFLALLATTAWHGGELVYRYGLGVMSMPEADGDGHDHEHADGHHHDHGQPDKSRERNSDEHDHHTDHEH